MDTSPPPATAEHSAEVNSTSAPNEHTQPLLPPDQQGGAMERPATAAQTAEQPGGEAAEVTTQSECRNLQTLESTAESKSLSDYASEINDAHDKANGEVLRGIRNGLSHAIIVGELLIAVKQLLPPKTLTDWVRKNCRFSTRTAQVYMQLVRHRAMLPEPQTSAVSSIAHALQLVIVSKNESKECDDTHQNTIQAESNTPPSGVNDANPEGRNGSGDAKTVPHTENDGDAPPANAQILDKSSNQNQKNKNAKKRGKTKNGDSTPSKGKKAAAVKNGVAGRTKRHPAPEPSKEELMEIFQQSAVKYKWTVEQQIMVLVELLFCEPRIERMLDQVVQQGYGSQLQHKLERYS
jgi:hypothetical protein